jgi:hypothetical protein
VDGVVADLAGLFTGEPPSDVEAPALTDALARAAGVPVVADAVGRAYRHRAIAVVGWPVSRWLRRLRPDPLRRLRLGAAAAELTPVTSLPPPSSATRAEVGLALRQLAGRAAGGLSDPWPAAILDTARDAAGDDLADALDLAVARTELGLPTRPPLWWKAVGALQWLATLTALVGLAWLGLRAALSALALPALPMPDVGRVPAPTALLLGGLLASLLISMLVRPIVRLIAARRRRRAVARLRAAVDAVARERVVTPVREALRAYRDGRTALREASGYP